jgi:hypothetical protein
MTKTTEYASAGALGLSAYEGLAQRTGKPLARIVELATQDRLGELFDARGNVGSPLTPAEALRRLDRIRHDPSARPQSSPGQLIGELRARKLLWEFEEEEARRRCDPVWRLGEILAKRVPPWSVD